MNAVAATATATATATAMEVHYMDDMDGLFATDATELNCFIEKKSNIFHYTQIIATREMLKKFEMTNLQLLLAEMQSGKTGSFLCLACAMIYYRKVDYVIVFTGVTEIDLYTQLDEDIYQATKEFEEVMGCEQNSIRGRIIHWKSSQLEKEKSKIKKRTLIIWDESHFAQDVNNRPFKMFQNNGLLVDGSINTNQLWNAKECYLLTVSATPFSEYLDSKATAKAVGTEMCKEITTLKPGYGYRGVKHYWDNGLVQASFKINETNKKRFIKMLKSRRIEGFHQFGLIRSKADFAFIAECAREAGWSNVMSYDEKTKKNMRYLDEDGETKYGWKMLETQPEEDTLIVLKGMGRVGQVVPKKYVSFVFEHTTGSKSDTLLQSLFGRMCGYIFNEHGTMIYTNPSFFEDNEVNEEEQRISLQSKIRAKEMEMSGWDQLDRFMAIVQVEREHEEVLEYERRSELQRYFCLFKTGCDIPRHANNIRKHKIRSSHSGMNGYSTVPHVIKLSSSRDENGEYTEIEKFARGMRFDKSLVRTDLVKILDQSERDGNVLFGDRQQHHEIMVMIQKTEEECPMNLGDLGAATHLKKHLPIRMKTSLENKMPYVDAATRGDWILNNKRIQLLRCSKTQEGGVATFTESCEIYLACVTYQAEQITIDKHHQQEMPDTTGKEVFKVGHELNDDHTYRSPFIITNEEDFTGFLQIVFPARMKFKLLFPSTVSNQMKIFMDQLQAVNTEKFIVKKVTGRPRTEDIEYGFKKGWVRYNIYFHKSGNLSL